MLHTIWKRLLLFASFSLSIAGSAAAAEGASTGLQRAIFAGGCFWCMEAPFDQIKGVREVTVGYTGGKKENPKYEEVSAGSTGHTESIAIDYDPKVLSYDKLLEVFWQQIDPLTENAQFCDHGSQYRTGIFYTTPEQQQAAEASKKALEASGRLKGKIVTEITAASTFYPAEDYHQHYYKKNPIRYRYYRSACGRDDRLDQIWGKNRLKHG